MRFTESLAQEWAPFGVRVNAVAPGPIDTPLLNAAPVELGELGERLRQGMIDRLVAESDRVRRGR
jgi:2-hydroxycyclohexanecarboxyl-CoA dehydrogenase